jgi:hypothetical protein
MQLTNRIKAEDRAKLDLAKAIRGYIDVQNVSSWYKNLDGDAAEETNSLFVPFDRPLTREGISTLRAVGENHRLIDLVDSGYGATMTTFGGALNTRTLGDALNGGLVSGIRRAVSGAGEPYRIHTESGCHNYGPLWRQGEGSGAATQYLLDQVDQANPSDPKGVLKINEKLRLVPGHCDPTCNVHDWYVGIRKGKVETLWPISARGKAY